MMGRLAACKGGPYLVQDGTRTITLWHRSLASTVCLVIPRLAPFQAGRMLTFFTLAGFSWPPHHPPTPLLLLLLLLQELRLKPTQVVYNALMAALARSHPVEHLRALFDEMAAPAPAGRGLAPDAYTFNALLTNLAQKAAPYADIEAVLQLMDK